jgi:hypothetical protein
VCRFMFPRLSPLIINKKDDLTVGLGAGSRDVVYLFLISIFLLN